MTGCAVCNAPAEAVYTDGTPVELDRDELEEKSILEHLGVLYVKGGYTMKEGTLVCLVLHGVAIQELCAHASLARKVVPCNNEGCHSCLEPDT